MKYKEPEKQVRKAGCYETGKEQAGHPLWVNPKTGVEFAMSHPPFPRSCKGNVKPNLKGGGAEISLAYLGEPDKVVKSLK